MQTAKNVTCQQCSGKMKRTAKSEHNYFLQIIGILIFLMGVALCFWSFPLGIIPGLIVMVAAAQLGYRKRKVWLCENCGYFFDRAK